jgi:hypothetical protein
MRAVFVDRGDILLVETFHCKASRTLRNSSPLGKIVLPKLGLVS